MNRCGYCRTANLVCVFGIDVVLNGVDAGLVEILGTDLDQVRNLGLEGEGDHISIINNNNNNKNMIDEHDRKDKPE